MLWAFVAMGIVEWILAHRRESAQSASTFSNRMPLGLPFVCWLPCKSIAIQCDPKPSNSDVRLSACTWTPRGLAGALSSPRPSTTFRCWSASSCGVFLGAWSGDWLCILQPKLTDHQLSVALICFISNAACFPSNDPVQDFDLLGLA